MRAFAENILGCSVAESSELRGNPKPGDWVQVRANKGAVLGWGHYSPNASIAVRMLSFSEHCPDESWWVQQVASAIAVRRDLGFSMVRDKTLAD